MVKDSKPEKIEKYLTQLNTTIENAQDILNKFAMLSKKSQISKSPIVVSTLLKDLLVIVSPMIKKRKIKITLKDKTKDISIMGNKSSFVQTILNIVINAADAIQEKNTKNGLIELICETIEINNKLFVRLIIRDNGTGMSPELLKKIYEPFFTTKGAKGTGLGLSIVFKEINELNGTITVFSEKGVGTEFVITVPALNIPAKDEIEEKEENMVVQNKKIIYLMDDDNLFRSSITDYLEYYGYEVYDFEKSEDLFKQLSIKIPDIMLLDFILEDSLTGEDILKYLNKHKLKFPVIILSGYIDLTITDLRKYENVKAIVQKPVSGEELLKKLKTFYEIN
jgi:CheY-like chemotaxis protein